MFIVAYFTFVGLAVGSAINALVWRLYVGRSWVKGRSQCPHCEHKLAAKDLVPVLSWLALGGKCRYCRKPIPDHPIVELVTAILFGLSAFVLAPDSAFEWTRLGVWLVMLTLLVAMAVYDARWLILPDKLMIPLIGVGLAWVVVSLVWTRQPQVAVGPLVAALTAGGGFYGLVAATKGRAMGGGDVKLAFAMGLMLGLQGTAVAMLLAFNVAALVGIGLLATRKRRRRDQIPFGPYLVGGTIVAFLYGREIVAWYLRINGLS